MKGGREGEGEGCQGCHGWDGARISVADRRDGATGANGQFHIFLAVLCRSLVEGHIAISRMNHAFITSIQVSAPCLHLCGC